MRISVVVCTYNGEKYIREQLQSILDQTMPVNEIIVCDDNSSDGTKGIIDSFLKSESTIQNTEVHLYRNNYNLGVTKNFEQALSYCTGDVIFLSDQDDIWTREKVEKCVNVFLRNQKCLMLFSNALLIDSQGKSLNQNLWDRVSVPRKADYKVTDFVGTRFVTGATAAIRRELLCKTLPIPDCWIHDAWLAMNASLYGELEAIDDNLIMYRQHEANVIGASKRSLIEQIRHTKKNIGKSMEFRNTMMNRFSSFMERNAADLNQAEKEVINECIGFWRDSSKLQKESCFLGIRTIIENLTRGKYKKFNHGIYGAMVDVFIIFSRS